MTDHHRIVIAIDGYSSCGKSTLAKALAKQLEYRFIDTGAMYRAVTLYMLTHNIPAEEQEQVQEALSSASIHFEFNQERQASDVYLNGECVEQAIREMNVSNQVSHYAAIKSVRDAMVSQQQAMGAQGGIVMDGRDIGTVVFPHAELKIFMTASPEVRAQRRFDELSAKGKKVTLEEVKENLKERDHIDSTREESPLKQATDARVLDNTNMGMEEQKDLALGWVEELVSEI